MAAANAERSAASAGAGVAAGATAANHVGVSSVGNPDSTSVGTSGSTATRDPVLTARARNWPLRTSGTVVDAPMNEKPMRPDSRSARCGAAPW